MNNKQSMSNVVEELKKGYISVCPVDVSRCSEIIDDVFSDHESSRFFHTPRPVTDEETVSFYDVMLRYMTKRAAEEVWTVVCQLGMGFISYSDVSLPRMRYVMAVFRVWQLVLEASFLGVPFLIETIELSKGYDSSFFESLRDVIESVRVFQNSTKIPVTLQNVSSAVLSHYDSEESIVAIAAILTDKTDVTFSVDEIGIVSIDGSHVMNHFEPFVKEYKEKGQCDSLVSCVLVDNYNSVELDFKMRSVSRFFRSRFSVKYAYVSGYFAGHAPVEDNEVFDYTHYPFCSKFASAMYSQIGGDHNFFAYEYIPDLVMMSHLLYDDNDGLASCSFDKPDVINFQLKLEFARLRVRKELCFFKKERGNLGFHINNDSNNPFFRISNHEKKMTIMCNEEYARDSLEFDITRDLLENYVKFRLESRLIGMKCAPGTSDNVGRYIMSRNINGIYHGRSRVWFNNSYISYLRQEYPIDNGFRSFYLPSLGSIVAGMSADITGLNFNPPPISMNDNDFERLVIDPDSPFDFRDMDDVD